jgi:uncharacterized protein (DUF1778 family)
MTKSRIDMRIDDEIKAAALLETKSLTEYIVRLIEKDARRVISEHESIVVKNDVFDRYMSACEVAEGPNQKLRDARDYAKERGIG